MAPALPPLPLPPTIIILLFSIALFASKSTADESAETAAYLRMRYVQAIWRHGDRAPLEKPYPQDLNDERRWPRGWGRLTKEGMEQMQMLGIYLRLRYAGLFEFISFNYSSEEVLVLSSDVDRTLESAAILLAALFPPPSDGDRFDPDLRWLPVAVHSTGFQRKDPLLQLSNNCERREQAIAPLKERRERELLSEYRDLAEAVRPYLNLTDGDAVKLKHLTKLRHIMPEVIHGLAQPDWVLRRWPSHSNLSTWELVWELQRQLWLVEMNGNDEISRLCGGHLLGTMLNKMRQIAAGRQVTPTKMMLYSAHDVTIFSLLCALGVASPANVFEVPPYASCLIMELIEDIRNGTLFVRFYYRRNNEFEEISLSDCPMDCPLNQLLEITAKRTLFGGEAEVEKACQI